MLAALVFGALWAHVQAFPAQLKPQERPLGPFRGYAEVRTWSQPRTAVAKYALTSESRLHNAASRHDDRGVHVRSLASSDGSSPQRKGAENAGNVSAANSFALAWATVIKHVTRRSRKFLDLINERAGGLSRIINVVIVLAGVLSALWSWFTATPQFISVFQNLLNSRSFMRLEAAWLDLPAQNWLAFERYISDQPWTSAAVITGVAYALADWTAQTSEGRGPFGFSRARLFRNMIVGAGLLGPYAHQYYEVQDRLIPGKGILWAPLKVFVDQTIYAASYNCLFLGGLGALQRQNPKSIVEDIKSKLPVMMKGSWRFWPFVHIFTYTIVPTRFKLLWVDAMDVIWVTYLSTIANARRAETTKVVQELVESQATGNFVEGWLAGRALSSLAERCAEIQTKMVGPEPLPPESERVIVTDDARRNLTVVQIAEGDRVGLMLDIMLSLRRQNVGIVHGIIDSTDGSLSANVFFVREEATKKPLSKERRDQLRDVLEFQLYKKLPKYPKEVTELTKVLKFPPAPQTTEAPQPVKQSEKKADVAFSPPPHAATELLYAIEVDKETRIEVGLALEEQGLQVPDHWWDGSEDREEREEEKAKKEEAEREERAIEEAERETKKEEETDGATKDEVIKLQEAEVDKHQVPEPMAELRDGVETPANADEEQSEERSSLKEKIIDAIEDAKEVFEDAKDSILEMDVKDSDIGDGLASIIQEAEEDAEIEEVSNKEEPAAAQAKLPPTEASGGGMPGDGEPALAGMIQEAVQSEKPLAEATTPARPVPPEEPSRLLEKATPDIANNLFALALDGFIAIAVTLAVLRYRDSAQTEVTMPLLATRF